MAAEDSPLRPWILSAAVISANLLMFVSAGFLIIALSGRFPFSGAYSSPLGVIKIGPKPTVWVCLLVLSGLARITLRTEGGRLRGLFAHPTATRLFLLALLVYNANGRQIGAVDTTPSRLLPYSILRNGDFDLDEFGFLHRHGVPAYLIQSDGHFVSAYPPGPAILALPFYLVPVLAAVAPDSKVLVDVEKLAASVLTALSVALLYAAINRLEGPKAALVLSLVYAFGTSSLSISSQALWQHGPSQLLLAASLYCLVRGMTQPGWVVVLGFPLALAVLCRPSDLLIAGPLAGYVLHAHRKHFMAFALSALPPALFMAAYNLRYFGSVTRIGYDQGFLSGHAWATPFLEGLSGVLFSPSRGLFVYSPVLLFSLVGMALAWRRGEILLFKYVSVAAVLVILLYSNWKTWWGGWSYGPRLLADLTPLLTLLLIPVFRRIQDSLFLKRAFCVFAAVSIAIHGMGAFASAEWSPDVGDASHRLWSWSDGELMNSGCRLLFKISGRCTPVDIPKLAITVDRAAYNAGEDVSVTLSLDAGRNPVPFDAYLKLLEEGASGRFLTVEGVSGTATPLISSSSAPGRREIRLSFPIARDATPGDYRLQGLLYRAGAPLASVDQRRDRLFESQTVMFTVLREASPLVLWDRPIGENSSVVRTPS